MNKTWALISLSFLFVYLTFPTKSKAQSDNVLVQVIGLRGQADFADKATFIGDKKASDGTFKVFPSSMLKLYFPTLRAIAILKANTHLTYKQEQDHLLFELQNGQVKWLVEQNKKQDIFRLHTANAAITGRGGIYLTKYSPQLKETELLVMALSAKLSPVDNPSDYREVEATEWIGLGGRFSAKLADKVRYPPELLKELTEEYNIKTRVLPLRKDPSLYNEFIPI